MNKPESTGGEVRLERTVRPTIQNLRYLNECATPGPWKCGEFSFMCKHMDAALIVKMRDLLPDFIGLWASVDLLDGTKPNGLGLAALPDVFKSLEELNKKASDVLG